MRGMLRFVTRLSSSSAHTLQCQVTRECGHIFYFVYIGLLQLIKNFNFEISREVLRHHHHFCKGRGELVLSTVLAQSLPCDPVMVLGDADEIPPNKLNEVKKLMIKVKKNKGLDAILSVMNKYFSVSMYNGHMYSSIVSL